MNAQVEREIKLDAAGDVELGDVRDAVERAAAVREESRHLEAEYFDTADLRLARWGCTVRHRNDAGWLVKLPLPSPDRMLERVEVPFDADGREPPIAAERLVSPLARAAALESVATVVTERQATQFEDAAGALLVELVDDRVTVALPRGETSAFRQIEVELGDGGEPSDADALLERLEARGCRRSDGIAKLVHALGAPASADPDVVVPTISDWPTGREVLHAAIASSVRHLLVHLPLARLGDVHGVHQSRVSVRRLRSDLRTFRTLVDGRWLDRLQPELRGLADALGRVRDDDVLLRTLGEIERARPLTATFEGQREQHRRELLSALDEARSIELLDELVVAAHDPPAAPQADDPADGLMRPLIRKRWRKLRDAVDELGDEPSDEALHAVRIRAKKCRYALDVTVPIFGSPARSRSKAIADLQDALGELNDATVIGARLADTDGMTPSAAFASGHAAGVLMSRADAGRQSWRDVWVEVARKGRWSWL